MTPDTGQASDAAPSEPGGPATEDTPARGGFPAASRGPARAGETGTGDGRAGRATQARDTSVAADTTATDSHCSQAEPPAPAPAHARQLGSVAGRDAAAPETPDRPATGQPGASGPPASNAAAGAIPVPGAATAPGATARSTTADPDTRTAPEPTASSTTAVPGVPHGFHHEGCARGARADGGQARRARGTHWRRVRRCRRPGAARGSPLGQVLHRGTPAGHPPFARTHGFLAGPGQRGNCVWRK